MVGIQRIDDKWCKSSHILYQDDGPLKPGAKTRKFNVIGPKYSLLGHVKWWGAWKKYCFFPLDSTLYDNGCLREIADFCEFITKEHKDALPKTKWAKQRLKDKRERKLERIKLKKDLTNREVSDTIGFESKEFPTS